MTAHSVICVLVPVRILSEANERCHWRVRASRAKSQKHTVFALMFSHPRPVNPAQVAITLTRIGPRDFDVDNLAGGFKFVQDGVAAWLGIDDGDKRLTWRYEQRRGTKASEYAAEIRVEWPAE